MKIIQLTKDKVAMVDDEDYETLSKYCWCYDCNGYAVANVNGVNTLMHNLLVNITQGSEVDHADRNTINNQKYNLRIATKSQNGANRGKNKNNTSGYKGVIKSKKKWLAIIKVNYKSIRIGLFDTAFDAAVAYDKAARYHFKEFAGVNFPLDEVAKATHAP